MPLALLALAVGAFGIGTTEFVIAGLLPEVARSFDTSVPTAGLLVSGYALAVAVGAPILTAATTRYSRKPVLVGLMAIFIAGNLLSAVAPSYGMLMAGRVFQVPPAETQAAVAAALDAGYRHIDTATIYRNEEAVGAALAASAVPREDLFLTTKVWNTDQGRDATSRSFDASLARLQVDNLDLYLIHWPAPRRGRYVDTWATLLDLQREGRMRSIGVSNFEREQLDPLAQESDVVPAVNQIELHPYLQQDRVARVALAWNLQQGNRAGRFPIPPHRTRKLRVASGLVPDAGRPDGRQSRGDPTN